ncbi:MAG: hypothetical protein IPN79_05725 [Saprospiraceae bacterium]|nr:hypothetical protein [Saprospiraceae bacterium]
MFNIRSFSALLVVIFAFSCNQGPDPALKEALTIQDEAIHIGLDLEKQLDSLMISDTSTTNLMTTGNIKGRIKMWRKVMIPVPGMKHDHVHEGEEKKEGSPATKEQDDHHHGHVHANPEEISAALKPEEIRDIQIDWKKEIEKLKAELEAYRKSSGK